MSDYRRLFVPGGSYFLTVATYNRQPILTSDVARPLLRSAIANVKQQRPFDLFATVLLPDHWHLIMTLPPADDDFSTRIKRIKEEFTRSWLGAGMRTALVTPSQSRKGECGVWQPRFWEHTVRGESDLEHCIDYIHWNPCKHRLVSRLRDWPWSSFHRFVQAGHYDIDWGGDAALANDDGESWGEP